MDGWIDGLIDVSMYRFMYQSMDGWVDGGMDRGEFYEGDMDQSMGSVVRG